MRRPSATTAIAATRGRRVVAARPGFSRRVCQEWEAATLAARDADIRVVNLRLGVVLSRNGGALAKMLTPFKLGVGGVIGSGRQYISWITLDDLVASIHFALQSAALSGPVNAVAPQPVTNREFTKTLGRVLGRPTVLPMPAFAAGLAFGEMADEMLLSGARVEPRASLGRRLCLRAPATRTRIAARVEPRSVGLSLRERRIFSRSEMTTLRRPCAAKCSHWPFRQAG